MKKMVSMSIAFLISLPLFAAQKPSDSMERDPSLFKVEYWSPAGDFSTSKIVDIRNLEKSGATKAMASEGFCIEIDDDQSTCRACVFPRSTNLSSVLVEIWLKKDPFDMSEDAKVAHASGEHLAGSPFNVNAARVKRTCTVSQAPFYK